uniref:Ras-related protein Rab-24 n=1 Tax=Vannella robusta TaxID=1487602 RepID=A0A7S4HTX9_9EUKA
MLTMSSSKVDVKVVLLGMHDVGKTCLVERYLHNKYKSHVTATVGAAFGAKKVSVGGQEITLGIWDTAGAERYESMSRIYYRSARAAVVCYDLTNKATYEKVEFWIDELLTNEENCDIYIVGTKMDLLAEGKERGIPTADVEEFARKIGADVFETSSKTGHNINEAFNKIAEDFVRKKKGKIATGTGGGGVDLEERPGAKQGGCCS